MRSVPVFSLHVTQSWNLHGEALGESWQIVNSILTPTEMAARGRQGEKGGKQRNHQIALEAGKTDGWEGAEQRE